MAETQHHRPKHPPKPAAVPVHAAPTEPSLEEVIKAPPGTYSSWHGMQLFAIDAETGDVKISVGADIPHDPASLTKLMTFYITCQALRAKPEIPEQIPFTLTDKITIAKSDMRDSGCHVKVGKSYSVDELMSRMMTMSDNAATNALARTIERKVHEGDLTLTQESSPLKLPRSKAEIAQANAGFSIIAQMNDVATNHGMLHSKFVNSDGFYPTKQGVNSTTPADMAALMQAIHRYFALEAQTYLGKPSVQYDNHVYAAHQKLNAENSSVALKAGFQTLAKTGYLGHAGYNINAYVTAPDGRNLVMVVMGSHNKTVEFARALGISEEDIRKDLEKEYAIKYGHRPHKVLKVHPDDPIRGDLLRDALAHNSILDVFSNPWPQKAPAPAPEKPPTHALPTLPRITAKQDGTALHQDLFLHLSDAERRALQTIATPHAQTPNPPLPVGIGAPASKQSGIKH